jgi:sugar phosphate isomerase/epimerase
MHRRTFLKDLAGSASALALAPSLPGFMAQRAPDWRKQIGLELYTVRDLMEKDFEGTIAKVAEIGYREVEPTSYGGLDARQFRALLDRYKLSAPSTHTSATEGPNLEKELAEHQIMGFKYTQIRAGGGPRPAQKQAGAPKAAPKAAPKGAKQERPPLTVEAVKRSAEQYNRQGKAAKKFGMKVLIHNHAGEFDKLEASDRTQYDILLAETDAALVSMQIDIGWALIAGQNVAEMFQKHPGRYELWHVKDEVGLKNIDANSRPGTRRATFVPIGQGEIDYKAMFAMAKLAGLKYYVIEQDNAAQNGADSMAAARANYQGLFKVLS